MNGVQIFLVVQALLWVPYGFYCLVAPAALAQGAMVSGLNPAGVTELRAMYGGLQLAIGLGCVWGAGFSAYRRSAVWILFVLTAGIGLGRFYGTAVDGEVGAYTLLALLFEAATALWAGRILTRPES